MHALPKIITAASLTLGTALTATAGGFTPPVVDAGVVAPIVETASSDWQGAYGGLTLGYAFNGKDEVGFSGSTGNEGDLGTLELNGVNGGLRVGYRWQRGNWVFGPELGYETGNIEDSISFGDSDSTTEVTSKVKNVLALRMKTGYAVRPDLLVYGIAGIARADVEYKAEVTSATASESQNRDFKKNGFVVGMGVEKQLTERMSVTGEYEYAQFGKTDRTFTIGGESATTEATPKYHNVKVGLNFKF